MSNVLTMRHLIDAIKKALAEETLGAFAHDGCSYDYGDGKHCAIGAALSADQIQRVFHLGLNHNGVLDLINNDIVSFNSDAERVVARITQDIHDSWAGKSRPAVFGIIALTGPLLPLRAFAVERVHNRLGTEQTFRDWIDLLDKTFPADGAAA